MADPFIQWSPERLRLIGITAGMAGAAVLVTIPLSNLDTTPRQRLLLAAAIGLSSYYSVDKYPVFMTAVTLGSLALAIGIPLIMSFRVVHDTIVS
jgi:hypothetical protein